MGPPGRIHYRQPWTLRDRLINSEKRIDPARPPIDRRDEAGGVR
jgi:hypothetical protein